MLIKRIVKISVFLIILCVICLVSPGVTSHEMKDDETIPSPVILSDTVNSQLSFLQDSLCRIEDNSHVMDNFLNELDLLLQGKDTIIKILHVGDSHIQAGFYTGSVMRLLQGTFGNAGRGWIAPYKLARVNEPLDYYIQSPTVKDWTVSKCTHKDAKFPYGPGGIAIQTASNSVKFKVRIAPKRGAGYSFNEIQFYRDPAAMPLLAFGINDDLTEVKWGDKNTEFQVAVDTFKIGALVDSIELRTPLAHELPEGIIQSAASVNRYYGFSLLSGNPGILYHSVGHNGAMFVNYINRDFIHQLSLFEPSLLIVSLGTNEAFGNRFREDEFESQMNECILLIKEFMPNTAILLTTPAECYKRIRNKGYQRNSNVSKVARTIRTYAQREGLACFDLYEMTGGMNSCKQWYQSSYYGRDRIHFTINGYEEQGKLLYKSLIRLKIDQQNVLL